MSGRFWLPSRQEIEIRRGGTWLDYPIRGIIRGRWEIGNYVVNSGLSPAFFNGPEIVIAPKFVTDTFHFSGRILDSLPPDIRAVTDADIRRVQEEARALVRAQALQRPQVVSLAVSGVSDFLQFNRAEGLALGAGLASRFGGGFGAQARGRYGFDDREVKGTLGVDWQSPRWGVRAFARRDFRDVGDVQERSRLVNSLAAQEFGSDATDPYFVEGLGLGVDGREIAGLRWSLDALYERQRALAIVAHPANGVFDPLVQAARQRALRVSLAAERPTSLWVFGVDVRAHAELRVTRFAPSASPSVESPFTVARTYASMLFERPIESGRLAFSLAGGAVGGTSAVPPQEWLYFGGPISAPGYAFHELGSLAGGTTRMEWRVKIPAPAVSLGRFGRVPARATLAPFAQATYARTGRATDIIHPSGVYPSLGIAVQPFFDLLRIQLARGLRNGRWSFNLDVARELWGVL